MKGLPNNDKEKYYALDEKLLDECRVEISDDLISRQGLRRAMYYEAMVKDSDEQKWDCGCWIRYKMFERVVDSMPSAPKWIPCSERLPSITGSYIVTGRMKYSFEKEWEYFTDVAYSFGKDIDHFWDTCNDWDEGQEIHIIAWMPVPEPWKGEESNND